MRKLNLYSVLLELAKLLYTITKHLPKDIKYTYGADIRVCASNCLKCIILEERAKDDTEKLKKLEECYDNLTLLEANLNICEGEYVFVVNKVNQKSKTERLISDLSESHIGELIISARVKLEEKMKVINRI